MYVEQAKVDIEATAPTDGPGVPEVAAAMRRLVDGGPFELISVEPIGFDRYRCVFQRRPRVAVGYRNVIDLQLRIDREFHIVEVTTSRVDAGEPTTVETLEVIPS